MAHTAIADKRAVAAAAPSRFKSKANGTQPSGGAPYELPNGQWCSKGTCHFNHDKVNPGGPCYRDPRWPGPLPERYSKTSSKSSASRTRERITHYLQVANLPICSEIAAGHEPEQVMDVNGIGVNFTLVNAVEAASGDREDDQGEQTDPSLDYAVSTNTNTAPFDAAIHLPTSPQAGAAARKGDATPLCQTPTMPHAPTTDILRARSGDEMPTLANLDAAAPNAEIPTDPLPKSWYVIIGGPFEGVRLISVITTARHSSGRRAIRKLPCMRIQRRCN
eukprot:3123425-Pleurochrysis_carterae.AAC.1